MFQEFEFKYVFGSDVVKNSLDLLADHRSKVRREVAALQSAQETVSAQSYFSEAAAKQSQRLREEEERKVEKEKARIFALQMERASKGRTELLTKERYCRFVDL